MPWLLLIHLIGVYEDRTVVPPRATPRQVLQHLMEQRHLKQADLVRLFGFFWGGWGGGEK